MKLKKFTLSLLCLLPLLPFCQSSGAFGTCSNPIGAFILNYYVIDWTTDDGINTDCHELTDCINPTHDAYYQFYLDSGPYIMTMSNGAGTADSVYLGVLNKDCDTLFGEFCGLSSTFYNFGIYRPDLYTVTINTRANSTMLINLVRGDITDEPYTRPMEPCGVISAIHPLQSPTDSVFLGRWYDLEVWRVNGQIRKTILRK